jgi:hypothetical protein
MCYTIPFSKTRKVFYTTTRDRINSYFSAISDHVSTIQASNKTTTTKPFSPKQAIISYHFSLCISPDGAGTYLNSYLDLTL